MGPRPSPCKGEKDPQVRALTCGNGVRWSAAEYLGVPSACYAGVMQARMPQSILTQAGRRFGEVCVNIVGRTTWRTSRTTSSVGARCRCSRAKHDYCQLCAVD